MASEQLKKIDQAVNRVLDVPAEYGLDLPKVTLLGNIQLYIENHQGIHSYQSDEIKIPCLYGFLVVRGAGLVLRSIERDELYIDGQIEAVEYQLR